METMQSKERVRRAIEKRSPDRVPMHMNATGWVLEKLNQALGTQTEKEIVEALHLDTFDMRGLSIKSGIMPRYQGPPRQSIDEEWSGDVLKIWGIEEVLMQTSSGKSWAVEKFNLSEAEEIEDMEDYPWPHADDFDYSDLKKRLGDWSGYALIASGSSFFQHPIFVRGMDVLLMDMAGEPELAHYVIDRFFEFYHEFYRRILQAGEGSIDIIAIADDLGTQESLMIGPGVFETFIAPKFERMAELAHSHGAKLLLHSDGNITSLIPRFIEIGIDILDPLQPEAKGMDPKFLKREYGGEICFRGGISAQETLAFGNRQDVIDETRRVLDILAPGGGYILSPGHPVLQDDIPVENIIAMYETGYEYRY